MLYYFIRLFLAILKGLALYLYNIIYSYYIILFFCSSLFERAYLFILYFMLYYPYIFLAILKGLSILREVPYTERLFFSSSLNNVCSLNLFKKLSLKI